jgi:hypothetical protein
MPGGFIPPGICICGKDKPLPALARGFVFTGLSSSITTCACPHGEGDPAGCPHQPRAPTLTTRSKNKANIGGDERRPARVRMGARACACSSKRPRVRPRVRAWPIASDCVRLRAHVLAYEPACAWACVYVCVAAKRRSLVLPGPVACTCAHLYVCTTCSLTTLRSLYACARPPAHTLAAPNENHFDPMPRYARSAPAIRLQRLATLTQVVASTEPRARDCCTRPVRVGHRDPMPLVLIGPRRAHACSPPTLLNNLSMRYGAATAPQTSPQTARRGHHQGSPPSPRRRESPRPTARCAAPNPNDRRSAMIHRAR